TGADSVFIKPVGSIDTRLERYARPTISGRQLRIPNAISDPTDLMLMPYDHNGRLMDEDEMPDLITYLGAPPNRERLLARTCVRRKPWYAFHETPPLKEILSPKLLWSDVSVEPRFYLDEDGKHVPRHTVYYAILRPGVCIQSVQRF